MSFLRKAPKNNILHSQSILKLTTRFFTYPSPTPFPDNPTSTYYDDLVNDAGRSTDFDTLRHLLNKRVRDGCFNTSNTFKFITNDESSLSMLDVLSQTLSRLDNGFPRKSAYDSLIARLCKLDRIEESLRLIEAMARGDYGLNACSFHSILSTLSKKKRMEESWRVMDLMTELGVTPDLTAYNYLLMSYCYIGDLTMAAEILTLVEGEGIRADTRTYDALVLGACKAGNVEGAMVLLRQMVDDGVPTLYSTHVYVTDALLKMGYYAQAVKFVMVYSGRDTWLDHENFGGLASRLIKLNRFDEARLVLEEMDKRGLKMGDKLKDFYQIHVKNINVARLA